MGRTAGRVGGTGGRERFLELDASDRNEPGRTLARIVGEAEMNTTADATDRPSRGRQPMMERTCKESFKVAADQLVGTVKKLVHEGNVRRVVIKQDGRPIVEFPLTVGVIGTMFAPI